MSVAVLARRLNETSLTCEVAVLDRLTVGSNSAGDRIA
jgi:hypothetical protein